MHNIGAVCTYVSACDVWGLLFPVVVDAASLVVGSQGSGVPSAAASTVMVRFAAAKADDGVCESAATAPDCVSATAAAVPRF